VEEEQEEEEHKRWGGRKYKYNTAEEDRTRNTIREKKNRIEKYWKRVIVKKQGERRLITK
jgi:hypothetical protein